MNNNSIPNEDHVVRYVKGVLIENETVYGNAFLLKSGENGLSVNWLEFFAGTNQYRLDEIRKRIRLTLARSGRFARLNVGKTKQQVAQGIQDMGINFMAKIDICSAPLNPEDGYDADFSHAEITNLPQSGDDMAMAIGDLIAKSVIYPLEHGKKD